MLALDAVRAAVLSDQPRMRLDELVRAELAAGRTTRQIYKSLMGMADEIDTTPGLTEDGSDAFGDTLDALTGYCRADQCYKDPAHPTPPSESEIAQLPRWAQVAFAARCALRVLPLVRHFWPDVAPDRLTDIRAAVGAAAATATGAPTTFDASLVVKADAVADAATPGAADAARAAARAANAADAACFEDVDTSNAAANTARAAFATARGAGRVSPDASAAVRRDFDHIASLAEWQKWADDTQVPPDVFGPLWPEGPPKGWPPITDVPPRVELVLEAVARDRATARMIEDDIVNLFDAVNRYHIARGGVRLTLEQFQSLISALVPAEV